MHSVPPTSICLGTLGGRPHLRERVAITRTFQSLPGQYHFRVFVAAIIYIFFVAL